MHKSGCEINCPTSNLEVTAFREGYIRAHTATPGQATTRIDAWMPEKVGGGGEAFSALGGKEVVMITTLLSHLALCALLARNYV